MKKFLVDVKSSFWFVPGLVVLLSIAIALAAIELDHAVGDEALARYGRLFGTRPDGSRQLLAAIASSTMTVAGVVFSITIVALSLTAAQYSPRVLRNFMSDRANQLVLGVFLGVYVYCVLVLRTVRGGDEAFVPGIGVLVAIILAVVEIGFLIFFIHHIATSIQASEIAARIARETIKAIHDRPQVRRTANKGDGPVSEDEFEGREWIHVGAPQTGYLQRVHFEELADSANKHGQLVRMERPVGAFVVRGEHLLSVSGGEALTQSIVATLSAAYSFNTYRDLAQDPAFGVEQLTEIAMKALSPGVNDTGTARNTLNYITAILCELAACGEEDPYFYRAERLVFIKRTQPFVTIMQHAFGSLRRNSVDNLDMVLSLMRALATVGRATEGHEARWAIAEELAALEESVQRTDRVSADRAQTKEMLRETFASVRADHAPLVRAEHGPTGISR